MTIREKILVIEDEKSISHFISTVLNNNGYEAMQAQTGEEALSMISSHCPDLIVLDLGLPDMDGLEVLRSVRKWSSLPIVVVSARNHERDKVAALDLGADDYLTKPFGTDELLARVRTAIRHTRTISGNDEIARNGTYTVGELVIDYNKHQVRVRGENVHLTLSEFRIVALLGKYVDNRRLYRHGHKFSKESGGFQGGAGTADGQPAAAAEDDSLAAKLSSLAGKFNSIKS